MQINKNRKEFFLLALTVFVIIIGLILVTFLFLLRPLHPADELSSAQEKFGSENYRGAIAELTEIISRNPNNVNAYILRGRAKDELGDKFGAIKDLTTAIELDPNNSFAYFSRGYIFDNNDSLKAAFQDYTNCIRLDNTSTPAYHNRATILAKWGRYSEALEDYDDAIQYSPNDTLSYLGRASLKMFKLGDKAGGCLDLSRAGELGCQQAYDLINSFCK